MSDPYAFISAEELPKLPADYYFEVYIEKEFNRFLHISLVKTTMYYKRVYGWDNIFGTTVPRWRKEVIADKTVTSRENRGHNNIRQLLKMCAQHLIDDHLKEPEPDPIEKFIGKYPPKKLSQVKEE